MTHYKPSHLDLQFANVAIGSTGLKGFRSLLHITEITCAIYSQLSLSRPRLSRITAHLEVKIWSLFKHRDLPTGNKILWKRREIAPRSNFSSFPQYFQYISNLGVKLIFILLKLAVRLIFFLSSANLICRSTAISKCFIKSLGFRDHES